MSEQKKFKLLAALREMNYKIKTDTFGDRLIFQKKTYLIQEMGVKIGNTFGWYLHGPYSREAANDEFQLVPIQNNIDTGNLLTAEEKGLIKKLEKILEEAGTVFPDKNEADLLEMLASLNFILRHGYPKPKDDNDAIRIFAKQKPAFANDSIPALQLLKKYGLN
jgi:uncharacterized protein YwgA